ncbi:rhombosortase [Vibrio rarus]|uniref:rhombosortase n=1 Tax=Vibrio rarus TaxID=413403 RepID=UPI0021C2AF06|nr:rhombosortase [Vibrio rarus]
MYKFLIAFSVLLAFLLIPTLSDALRWEHDLIATHQWWRLITGNFTHTNLYHLLMNLAGLWVICYLFNARVKPLLIVIGLLSSAIGVGLLFTSTHTYYGFSGVLHGLFAWYAYQEVESGKHSSWFLLAGLGLKLLAENSGFVTISSAELINARVSTESHLIGAISGLIIALLASKVLKQVSL